MKRKYQKLRDSARGEQCTLQIHPYCNNNPETTVLCHLPSDKGFGQKSPDYWAAYGCQACHSIIDGGVQVSVRPDEIQECMRRGHFRTLEIMIEKGLIAICP